MRNALLAAALFIAPAAVMAEGFSYTFVDGRYFSTDSDALSINQHGGSLAGSVALGSIFFVAGDASYGKTEKITVGTMRGSFETIAGSARLGARHALTPVLDVVGSVGGLYGEVKGKGAFNGNDDDDIGYVGEAGLRMMLIPQFEVAATYSYQDIFNTTQSGFTGDLQFHFSEHFSAVASATFAKSTDVYTGGLRYRF